MTESLIKGWGVRLRQERIAAGLTQQQLADAAGITAAQISNIERGASGAGNSLRIRLATALGTTVAELFPYPDAIPA